MFVLLFGAGLIWFAFWLAKYGLKEEFSTYKLQMSESVSGLSKDSNVKLRGVNIGRVSQIRISPENIENIEVFLKIKSSVPIKKDMFAQTQMLGATGLLFIEISGGTNAAETLEPTDDFIPVIPTRPSFFSRLGSNIGTVSDRLSLLLVQSEKLFSDHNIKTLGTILDHVEKMTARGEEVEQKAITSLQEIDETLRAFRDSMARVTQEFESATKDFSVMKENFVEMKEVVNPTVKELMSVAKNFDRATLKVEKSLDRGDYNLKKIFEPMLVDIALLTTQINDLAQQLEESPSDVLFKARKAPRGPGE